MLEVKNLKKKFGNNYVLKGINFSVSKGDIIAIIGPSGCGKSTLLRSINLLEIPDSGEVIFNGENILDKKVNINNVRKKIGMVFQQFNLFDNMTVLDNITLAPVKLGLMDREIAVKKAFELLKRIGLYDKKDNYPSELSGGQKQRIAIIRSLIMNPEIILFDEPTSALDPEMVQEVMDLIKSISLEGMTMIIVSHELNFVRNIANKVLFIDNGKVSFFGDTELAFNNSDNDRLRDFLDNYSK